MYGSSVTTRGSVTLGEEMIRFRRNGAKSRRNRSACDLHEVTEPVGGRVVRLRTQSTARVSKVRKVRDIVDIDNHRIPTQAIDLKRKSLLNEGHQAHYGYVMEG